MVSLTGKVAIVTGGSSDSRSAICKRMAEESARVVVRYGSHVDLVNEVIAIGCVENAQHHHRYLQLLAVTSSGSRSDLSDYANTGIGIAGLRYNSSRDTYSKGEQPFASTQRINNYINNRRER